MKKNAILIIVIISVIVLVTIACLFIYFDIFGKRIAVLQLSTAIKSGKIEVMSDADTATYFTFVSADEAKKLLADADTSGAPRFLLPQFSTPDGKMTGVVIKDETADAMGKPVRFITISGLPIGTVVYSNSDDYIQGGISANENPYAWIRTKNIKKSMITTTYLLAATAIRAGASPFKTELDTIYRPVGMGVPLTDILTENRLDEGFFPKDAQVAFSVSSDEDFTLADLNNVLMKDGKIVMIKQ